MSRYELVIFDFDGTLADSFDWFIRTLPEVVPRHGLPQLSTDEWQALRGLDARTIMRRLGLPLWKVPSMAREMRRRMHEDIERIALFDGVPALLADLKSDGHALAIVSSNSAENVRRVLGAESAGRIDVFACGSSLFGKRAGLGATLKRLRCAPTAALYVGDEIRDAEAASAAGIAFAAVAWGFTLPDALQQHTGRRPCANLDGLRAVIAGQRSLSEHRFDR